MSMYKLITPALVLALAACGGGGAGDSADQPSAADTAKTTAKAAGRIATALAAPEATLVDLDPCELLTVDDAKPHLDGYRETEQETAYGMKGCKHKGGSFTDVYLEIGGMDLDGFESTVASNHRLMEDVELQEVPGLGDKAYFLRSLWVQSGDYILQIRVNSLPTKRDDSMQTHLAAASELAKTALGRL